MEIRQLKQDEVDAAARVHRTAFYERLPWLAGIYTPEQDQAYYRDRVSAACAIWGAVEAGEVIGIIAFREGWVDQLYILPAFQRRGVGSALLDVARRFGPPLKLWTFQKNTGARNFSQGKGFFEVERTDGAGNEEREPDVLYQWGVTDVESREKEP